jgi:[acyl-carrier-protein] S-malonyltransferase
MGKDLYDNFEEVKTIYENASEAVGYDIAELSFNGPKEELDKTFRTQPALVTASYSAFSMLNTKGISPLYVAGHSLGEYSALVAAGVITLKNAVKLTENRGKFMQEAVPEGKGLMAAVLGLERGMVEKICNSVTSGYVSPANYNCPGQIVISGEKSAVEDAVRFAEDAGAKRAVILAVSVPSHSRLMISASKKLSTLLDEVEFQKPQVPVVNNADADFLEEPEKIKDSLLRQLNSPLLWEDSVQKMVQQGVECFIEVGPKKVLSGLIKRIDRDVRVLNVEDMRSLESTLNELG